MAYADESPRLPGPINEHASALAHEWRRLTRAATAVALITAPAFFLVLYDSNHLSLLAVADHHGDRGGDVPRPGRGGDPAAASPPPACTAPTRRSRPQDIVARRRYWYWRGKFRRLPIYVLIVLAAAGACAQLLLALGGRQRAVLQSLLGPEDDLPAAGAAPAGARVRAAAAAVLHQLRDLLRPVPVLRRAPDPRLRARRRELGREDRRRPRAGRGQGGDHPRDHASGSPARSSRRPAASASAACSSSARRAPARR